MTSKFKRSLLLALFFIPLSACSTLEGVGDRISDLNPFGSEDGKPDASQGDIPDQSERITIISLEDELTVGDKLTPADVLLPAPSPKANWAQGGGGPTHAIGHLAANGNLDVAWRKGVGKGNSAKGWVASPPVISNGVIYAMDSTQSVTAVRAGSGDKLWTQKITVKEREATRTRDTRISEQLRTGFSLFRDRSGVDRQAVGGGVAVDGNVVYVASGYGRMIALDANSGSEIWRTATDVPLHSAPTISDGRVFAITDDNEVFAFDARSGDVLWTYQGIIETARMLTAPSVAAVDDVVLVPFSSGELVALRAQNGTVLWQDALTATGQLTPLSTLNDIGAGPVVGDGYVIASSQSGATTAFDLRSGQRIWNQPAGSLGYPLMVGDFVYVVTTDAQVVCMSRADGSVVWISQLQTYVKPKKQKERISWAGPLLVSGKLFVVGTNGEAVLLNPQSGDIQRSYDIGKPVFAQPVFADGTIYLLNEDADIVALR